MSLAVTVPDFSYQPGSALLAFGVVTTQGAEQELVTLRMFDGEVTLRQPSGRTTLLDPISGQKVVQILDLLGELTGQVVNEFWSHRQEPHGNA